MILLQKAEGQEIVKNSNEIDTNYKRSSLYTLMITDASREYESDIKSYFLDKVLPEKYNNHNLENRTINRAGKKIELDNIVNFLNTEKIAHKLIAKWFNRKEDGSFDMSLIRERGFYDASVLDINTAKNTTRGLAQLADAGEELIGNTFILVNDSRYTNKEEVAGYAKSFLGSLTSQLGVSVGSYAADLTLTTFGKGFVVSTNSHLFKLVWDKEIESRFYNELYFDNSEQYKRLTKEQKLAKKNAFDNADFFALEYIGTDKSSADVQSSGFTTKTNSELIGRATVKSIDNVITKLQYSYDVFKTKTPIYTDSPLTAKIGLKEGLTKKTKFEVLEQQQMEDGSLAFVPVGIIKVDTKYPIWDNRYGADEENPNQETDRTHFKVVKGNDFMIGSLIRQIK